MHVSKPFRSGKYWLIQVRENASPFSKVIETVNCLSRETAYTTYLRMIREKGGL